MRDEDLVGLLLAVAVLVVLGSAVLALIAGNVANQLFAPLPSVAGPLGAGVALTVFVLILIKIAQIVFR